MKGQELMGAGGRARMGYIDHTSMVPLFVKNKKITIESLLVWAYADELVHAARPEGMPAELTVRHGTGFRSPAPGAAVDRVSDSVKMDFEAPADAYAVHAAVLRLGRVDVAVMADPSHPSRLAAIAGERAPDSVVVRIDLGQLAAEHAMRGARPEWFPHPTLRMKPGQTHYHARTKRPWFCAVTPEGDLPHEVDRARRLYGVWCDSLRALCAALTDRLARHVLLADLPPSSPWRAGGA